MTPDPNCHGQLHRSGLDQDATHEADGGTGSPPEVTWPAYLQPGEADPGAGMGMGRLLCSSCGRMVQKATLLSPVEITRTGADPSGPVRLLCDECLALAAPPGPLETLAPAGPIPDPACVCSDGTCPVCRRRAENSAGRKLAAAHAAIDQLLAERRLDRPGCSCHVLGRFVVHCLACAQRMDFRYLPDPPAAGTDTEGS